MPMVQFEKVKGKPEHGHFEEMVPDEKEKKQSLSNREHLAKYPELYKREYDWFNLKIKKTKRKKIVSWFPFKREYHYMIADVFDCGCVKEYAKFPSKYFYGRYHTMEQRIADQHHFMCCLHGNGSRILMMGYKEAEEWIKKFMETNNDFQRVNDWGGDGNPTYFLKDGTSRQQFT